MSKVSFKDLGGSRVEVTQPNGKSFVIAAVHSNDVCKGRPCVIHNPSDHGMSEMPIIIRSSGLIERCCEHGVGHPDPDSLDFFVRNGQDFMAVHGCDGCCRES